MKRIACDASVVVVSEDERGTPLTVSRKQRTVSTPIRRAIWARDRHCTFPGCHRTRLVEAHHVEHWVDGGETSVDNLTLHDVAASNATGEVTFHEVTDENSGLSSMRPDAGGTSVQVKCAPLDAILPPPEASRLYEALRSPKTFLYLRRATHIGLSHIDTWTDAAAEWLDARLGEGVRA